ncbi:hypothetical protein MLD38_015612 [Melastoma candidum]|uniref:Uncharacterized protein n=1 Tax=Melastoma candidum TaxID=119954 RepID=A0ACB9RGH0_9MYRT|nr:hypothetical protein MLD38_015612 [Melastoma candidum]
MSFLKQPNDFSFNSLKEGILRSRLIVKDLINADDVPEISIVDNATTAAAIVLQQMAWRFNEGTFRKGDAVVMLHYAYGAVKKSVEAYVTRARARVIEVPLLFPVISKEQIVSEFRKALERGKGSEARGDRSVTSMPSVVIPVKELVKICREEGVGPVFDVDMKDIEADFYTSNLHKWFFCPPSVAFLYHRKFAGSDDLHHPVVLHEYSNGLAVESAWIGTRDYSSQLVVPSAL